MNLFNLFKKKKPVYKVYDDWAVRESINDYLPKYYKHKYASAFKGMKISLGKRLKKYGFEGYKTDIILEFRMVKKKEKKC